MSFYVSVSQKNRLKQSNKMSSFTRFNKPYFHIY